MCLLYFTLLYIVRRIHLDDYKGSTSLHVIKNIGTFARITEKSHTKNANGVSRHGVRTHLTPLVWLRHCRRLFSSKSPFNHLFLELFVLYVFVLLYGSFCFLATSELIKKSRPVLNWIEQL